MWDHQTPLYDIMDGLNRVVRTGKTRYIGISNCYAWQLAKTVDLTLDDEELRYLEELYVPHTLVGVMAQNTAAAAREKHVWSVGSQKI